jgi:hypothetical protein
MERKLTTRELAPYLPHGLSVKYRLIGRHSAHKESILEGRMLDSLAIYQYVKPLLRPLSQLTEEIEHNGEEFVPIRELFQMAYMSVYDCSFGGDFIDDVSLDEHLALKAKEILDLPPSSPAERNYYYGFTVELPNQFLMSVNGVYLTIPNFTMYQKLFEWHFDVFGLIEAGLAVELNDKTTK